MSIYDLVFWEPCVSPHKADLIKRLAALPDINSIRYVAHERESAGRAALGWPDLSSELGDLTIAPDAENIRDIVAKSPSDAIHVFSGFRHFRVLEEGLREVTRQKRRFGLYHEPRVSEGFAGKLRLIQSIVTERHLRKEADFVLAIGRNGPPWFRRVGYPESKIFPFAYFIDAGDHICSSEGTSDVLRTAYVGRLVSEKGIDHFLRLAERLASEQHRFIIAGAGSHEPLVRSLAISNPYVSYLGSLKLSAVNTLMASVDILVVPSQSSNDGWGVVVTEGLLAGAYIITNHKVGASIVLNNDLLGNSARSPDYAELESAMLQIISNATLFNKDARERRRHWAKQNLTANAGAQQLISIFKYIYDSGPAPTLWPHENASTNDFRYGG